MVSHAAQVTLTFPGLSLAGAETCASRIEADVRLEPLAVTINETDEANSLWETVAFFASEAEAEGARLLMAAPEAMVAPVPDVDWVRHSLEGLAPVTAGRFYLHGSHDRHGRRAGGLSLEIDAGTAFGTGHHGTTTGCLLALDDLLKRRRPQRMLDLGCGTGVLAIAAACATRNRVLATDIDPEAVRVTRLNAALNRVAPAVAALTAPGLNHRSIRSEAPFDLVFANILARPLINMAQGLSLVLAPGGTLILSGLTRDQLRWVWAAYRNRGLRFARVIFIGNWVTLALRQPKRKRPLHKGSGRNLVSALGRGWEND
jgi:ribosomal protein L11 methyltransferase